MSIKSRWNGLFWWDSVWTHKADTTEKWEVTLADWKKVNYDWHKESLFENNFSRWWVVDTIKNIYSRSFWYIDDIQDELGGLTYNGKAANESQRSQYVQMLDQYNYLNNKEVKSASDVAMKLNLWNELDKYKTTSREQGFWAWFWDKTAWLLGTINMNGWKEREIDRDIITKALNDDDKQARLEYWVQDPEKVIDNKKEEEIKTVGIWGLKNAMEESNKNVFVQWQNQKIEEVAKNMIANWYIANSNPWWRASTLDEVLWDIYSALWTAVWVSKTLDSYGNLYWKIWDDWDFSNISNALLKSRDSTIEMIGHMLEYKDVKDKSNASKEAYLDYVNKWWDVWLDLLHQFANLSEDQMSDKELALIKGTLGVWAAMWDWDNQATNMVNSFNQLWWDEHHTGLVQFWYDMFWELWILLSNLWWMLSTIEWWVASSVDWIIWWMTNAYYNSMINNMPWAKETVDAVWLKDFYWLYYWHQSSWFFNMKEEVQSEYKREWMTWRAQSFLSSYLSIVDDIVSFRAVTKVVSWPVKIMKLSNIARVWATASKVEKAVETTAKIEKAVETTETAVTWTEKIISWAEKTNQILNKTSKLTRLKDWAIKVGKYLWGKITEPIKTLGKNLTSSAVADASLWTKALNISENIARWVWEEALTSAMMQWFTSYDYESVDLWMDILWWAMSGFTRTLSWINQTWMVRFAARDKVWAIWYLKDVEWLSEADALSKFERLSEIDQLKLGKEVREKLWIAVDTTEWWTKGKFKTKAQAAWEAVRKSVNDLIEKTVHASEQKLMRSLSMARDTKISWLVKKVRVTDANWNVVTEFAWNTKYDLTSPKQRNQFFKQVDKARAKLHSDIYNEKTISWRVSTMHSVGVRIKKNLNRYLKRYKQSKIKVNGKTVNVSDYIVSDGKWWYKFKKWVTKEQKQRIFDHIFKKEVAKVRDSIWGKITRANVRNTKQKAISYRWRQYLWARDEVRFRSWPIWLFSWKVDLFINGLISRKLFDKNHLIAMIYAQWALFSWAFFEWFSRLNHDKNINDLTKEELVSALEEFWKICDEQILPQFAMQNMVYNLNKDTLLTNSKELICNKSYEDAGKANPHLRYMDIEVFKWIAWDPSLSVVDKEIKLRCYRHLKWINGKSIYWIDLPSPNIWKRIVFNDTYEEKMLFWSSWDIYIKYSDSNWWNVISKREPNSADWNFNQYELDRKSDWVIACTYKKNSTDSKTWESIYSVYRKWNWDNLIWYIKTGPDVEWWAFDKQRYIEFSPNDQSIVWSVEFSIDKKAETRIFDWDVRLEVSDDVNVTDETFKLWDVDKHRTSTLHQWNELGTFIRSGSKEYSTFYKLIPWYTDNVSMEYFSIVMNLEWLRPVDRMNLLIAPMFNKQLTRTADWLRIDMSWSKQFKSHWYTYKKKKYNQDWKVYDSTDYWVPSDWEIMLSGYNKWMCIVQTTASEWSSVLYYERKWNEFILFDKPPQTPRRHAIGKLEIWDNWIKWYMNRAWSNKHIMIDKSVEFINWWDVDTVKSIEDIRWWTFDKKFNIKKTDDDTWSEVFSAVHWREITASELHQLKSTPNLTPEKYFNWYVKKFQSSPIWRYVKFRSKTWRTAAIEMQAWKPWISVWETISKVEKWNLSDKQIFDLVSEVKKEFWTSEWFKLSDWEVEIRNILYWDSVMMTPYQASVIRWHSKYWLIPEWVANDKQKRLRSRRDNILMAIYKDANVITLSDWEKELLIRKARRNKWMLNMSEEELMSDIRNNPGLYKKLIKWLWKIVVAMEEATDTASDEARLSDVNKKILDINIQLWGENTRKYILSENREYIENTIYEFRRDMFNEKLQEAEMWLTQAMEEWNTELVEQLTREVDELKQSLDDLNKQRQYNEYKNALNSLTQEDFQEIYEWQRVWVETPGLVPRLTQEQIDQRISDLQSRAPGVKIIMRDPVTWEVTTRWFTNEEADFYKERINTVANELNNDNISALHVRDLHAIVIDPRNVSSLDVNHEWFHEALNMVYTKEELERVRDVIYSTRNKNKELIEKFAENRWYDELYSDLRAKSLEEYKAKITEEWLADRFAEYIVTKNDQLFDNDLLRIFKELWNRLVTLLSDTWAVELFDDIYEWRLNYRPIDLSESADLWVNYRSKSKAWNDYFEQTKWKWLLWDWWVFKTYRLLKEAWVEPEEIVRWFNSAYSWLWSVVTSIVSKRTWRSFDDIVEFMCDTWMKTKLDSLDEFLYWDPNLYQSFVDQTSFIINQKLHEAGLDVLPTTRTSVADSQQNTVNYQYVWNWYVVDVDFGSLNWNRTWYSFTCKTDWWDVVYEITRDRTPVTSWPQEDASKIVENILNWIKDEINKTGRVKWMAKIQSNIFNTLTKYDVLNNMPDEIINEAVDTLQDVIWNYEFNLGKWAKDILWFKNISSKDINLIKDSYLTYLFNRYIPHVWWVNNKLVDALMDRKTKLTVDVINRIRSNDKFKYNIISELDDQWNLIKDTFNLEYKNDSWEVLYKIWWHSKWWLKKTFGSDWDDILNGSEELETSVNAVWNNSPFDYELYELKNLFSSKWSDKQIILWDMWQDEAKSIMLAEWWTSIDKMQQSNWVIKMYTLGARNVPVYVKWDKWFVIEKSLHKDELIKAINTETNWWTLYSASVAIARDFWTTKWFWEVTLLWRKKPNKYSKVSFPWYSIFSQDSYSTTIRRFPEEFIIHELRRLDWTIWWEFKNNVKRWDSEETTYNKMVKALKENENMQDFLYKVKLIRDFIWVDDLDYIDIIADAIAKEEYDTLYEDIEYLVKNSKNLKYVTYEDIADFMKKDPVNRKLIYDHFNKWRQTNALSNELDFINDKVLDSVDDRYVNIWVDSSRVNDAREAAFNEAFVNWKTSTIWDIAEYLYNMWFITDNDVHRFMYDMNIFSSNWRMSRYLEMYSPMRTLEDFYWIYAWKDDADDIIKVLDKTGYKYKVVDLSVKDDYTAKEIEEMAKEYEDYKWFIVFKKWDGIDDKITNEFNKVDFKTSATIDAEDIEEFHNLKLLWTVSPISKWELIESNKRLRNSLRKYNVDIRNASPEVKEEMTKSRNVIRNNSQQQSISRYKRRYLEWELRKLQQEADWINSDIASKQSKRKDFEETNRAYKELTTIKSAIDSDPKLYKAIKKADDTKLVVDPRTVSARVPWALDNPARVTKSSWHPPIWTYFEREISWPEEFINKIEDFEDLQIAWIESWDLNSEREIVSWYTNPENWNVYPVTQDNLFDDDMLINMSNDDYFVIWWPDKETVDTVLNNFKSSFYEHIETYKRDDWTVVYMRRLGSDATDYDDSYKYDDPDYWDYDSWKFDENDAWAVWSSISDLWFCDFNPWV